MIKAGELVLLVSPDGKRYLRPMAPGTVFHTQDGKLDLDQVARVGFGAAARTHRGTPYRVLAPTLYELIKGVKRSTTIMYPKEIGYVLLKLGPDRAVASWRPAADRPG